MRISRIAKTIIALVVVCLIAAQSVFACTVFLVGKDATTDGSTITTHNDDSSGADFRLWIIPGMENESGAQRDLVMDSHNYADFSTWPYEKDYGNGTLVSQMDDVAETNAYLHSRYSFINDKGVAMGETTMSCQYVTDQDKKNREIMNKEKALGIIDCWNAQDIALERASTAREAVEIIGQLCEDYGWYDAGETINICDGTECWVIETYGGRFWVAFRLPDNAFFVGANRARITYIDWDSEDWLYTEDIYEFAKENGMTTAEKKDFNPAATFAPSSNAYSFRREWRAMDLVAPSLGLDPTNPDLPLWVIPEQKLSVNDVFKLTGDYYQGTEYDVSKSPEAGPYGDPLVPQNVERTINLFRTCYVMIANVKEWLPDEAKCLVWYGYGAPDSTYITPLWPSMTELPEFYQIGSRYEEFRRDSGWWVNSYVQQVARINYQSAIQDIYAFRDPIMADVYATTEEIQAVASRLILEGNKDAAIRLLTDYGCVTATKWHEDWLKLGDQLLGRYMWGNKNMKTQAFSDSYKTMINEAREDYNK